MRALIDALDFQFFKVHVFCGFEEPFYSYYKKLDEEKKIKLVPFTATGFSILKYFKLSKYIKENRISIIHSHGKGAGVWSRALKIFHNVKVIHTFRGLHYGHYKYVYRKIYFLVERSFALLTDHFICVSNSEKDLAISLGFAKKEKVSVIHNSVDTNKFRPILQDSKIKFLSSIFPEYKSSKIIGFIGRFSYQKNIPYLLNVLNSTIKSFDNVIGIIAGVSEDIKEMDLKEQISKCEAKDHIFVINGSENISTIIASFDVFVITSRWEGFPTVILEAMSCEIPVVATDVTGNKDAVIDGKTGFLIKPDFNDTALWESKIGLLLNDENLRKKMGRNGREFVISNFYHQKTVEKHIDLYKKQ